MGMKHAHFCTRAKFFGGCQVHRSKRPRQLDNKQKVGLQGCTSGHSAYSWIGQYCLWLKMANQSTSARLPSNEEIKIGTKKILLASKEHNACFFQNDAL